jgi:hypothetical protein
LPSIAADKSCPPTGRTEGGSGSGSSSISAPQGQTTWSAVTLTASTTRLSAIFKVKQIYLAAATQHNLNRSACHTNLTGLPCSLSLMSATVCPVMKSQELGRIWKRHYPHRNEPTISLHEMREPCALEQGLANRLFLLTSRPSVLCSSGNLGAALPQAEANSGRSI